MDNEKKSPLKAAPLRVAGESLDRQIDDAIDDELLLPFLLALMAVVLAATEWWRYATDAKPSPWGVSIIALAVCGYALFRWRRGFRKVKALKLGRSGERAVAQYLEWFRTKEFFVFHDVPSGDANIDHVLLGTRGLYVIETKTLSKPVRGECRITVAADGIRANGRPLDRNPILQAKAQARWLYDFLGESGFKHFVRPVVVFPGWFVERFDMKALGVWVLEPKALDAFIEQEPVVLTHDQVRAMASALSSYIRSKSTL
jgi:hypothetical protein